MKIPTKSLASLAFAGVVAVPVMTSSVYGAGNTPANSQNQSSTNNSNVQLLALDTIPVSDDEFPQDSRLCKYEGNRDLDPTKYIKSCMKLETINKIPELARDTPMGFIQDDAADPEGNMGLNNVKKDEVEASIVADKVLKNESNLRPPEQWTYQYNETYRKEHGLGEYSDEL
jgi:hypothetical protein